MNSRLFFGSGYSLAKPTATSQYVFIVTTQIQSFCTEERIFVLTLPVGIFGNFDSDFNGALSDGAEWRIDAAFIQIRVCDVISDSLRRDEEKILPDMVTASGYNAQGDSGENVRVISLSRLENLSFIIHFTERRSR